jgi:K+-sensing histidine kinase KdpD
MIIVIIIINYCCTIYIGLGLWICQKIIDLHKGTIRFSSEGHGKGTTFIVELPLFPNVRIITYVYVYI